MIFFPGFLSQGPGGTNRPRCPCLESWAMGKVGENPGSWAGLALQWQPVTSARSFLGVDFWSFSALTVLKQKDKFYSFWKMTSNWALLHCGFLTPHPSAMQGNDGTWPQCSLCFSWWLDLKPEGFELLMLW